MTDTRRARTPTSPTDWGAERVMAEESSLQSHICPAAPAGGPRGNRTTPARGGR